MTFNPHQTADRDESLSEFLSAGDIALSTGGLPDTQTIIGGESVVDGRFNRAGIALGSTVGKYQIRSKLGSGGMGAVYLAFDPMIEREVAIKVLSQDVAASAAALQRFLQEARAIGRLNHPNVVSIYDIDQWNGQYYLVMELLSGGSLAQHADRRGPLPWPDACGLVAQAASGLAAAHAAGLIHRDIKPENLMLTRDGLVKVVDFGLSKLVDADSSTRTTVTQAGQILGTPQYMSPEQFEATEIDARTDIYSLGGTLFRLLTAHFPYYECGSVVQVMTAHLTKPPPVATRLSPSLPAECDRIIARAMAKRPADRYQTAAELADELLALIHSHRDARNVAPEAPAATAVRHLKTAVIVEPSRMLASMFKDVAKRAGLEHFEVVQTRQDALLTIRENPPDLLLTSMQLSDGRGVDLLAELDSQQLLTGTCVVLSSSDSTMQDLAVAHSAGSRILAPKNSRHDDLLHVVHAVGPRSIAQGPIAAPLDPASVRLIVVTDADQFPGPLTRLIQPMGLQNGAIVNAAEVAALPADGIPTVQLVLRTGESAIDDDQSFATTAAATPETTHLRAVVQVTADKLTLRAVFRKGITATVRTDLDASRLTCLLQACRTE